MTKLFTILIVGIAMIVDPGEVRAQQAASDQEGVIAASDQRQPDGQARQDQDQDQDPPQAQQQAQVQQPGNVPPAAQRVERQVQRVARRFDLGVQGGAGLDPEIIDVGVHAMFGPIFSDNLAFRPVFEIGAGEVTTLLGINLDLVYTFPGNNRDTTWIPYIGGGPQFGLSHQGFGTDDLDNVDGVDVDGDADRFDFSDTDFNGGMNFIVGMKRQSGAFFEMKATAWGVSTIRLLAGFNFYGWGGSPR